MVNCITPATGPAEIALVEGLGLADAAPVTCEPFRQWVLEDRFPQGRPALEEVGVEFTADVAPYELMKLRLPNGLYAALGYSGALSGYGLVHEAVADAHIRAFLVTLARREIMSTLAPIPWRGLRRLPRDPSGAVRQRGRGRHHPAALPRRLEPPAEVRPAHPARRAGRGRADGGPRARGGAVAQALRHGRAARRPPGRAPARRGPGPRSGGDAGNGRGVRRARGRSPLREARTRAGPRAWRPARCGACWPTTPPRAEPVRLRRDRGPAPDAHRGGRAGGDPGRT